MITMNLSCARSKIVVQLDATIAGGHRIGLTNDVDAFPRLTNVAGAASV